jgi:NDP-sugar pyrophosphorylase family protein
MAQRHHRTGAVATVALTTPNLPRGVVRTGVDHRIVEFQESLPSPRPINAGV